MSLAGTNMTQGPIWQRNTLTLKSD